METPEQQMLQTLISKVEDMRGRMQQELDNLRALVGSVLQRVPEPACTTSLAELRPPPDETAEQEAQRVAKDILDRGRWNYEDVDGGFSTELWLGRVRHECNRALLRSNGFHVHQTGENNYERGIYVRW